MKTLRKFLTILAVLALVFTFTACKDDEDEDESAHLGSTLNLSGQVYTKDDFVTYNQFNGDRTVSAGYYVVINNKYQWNSINGGTGGISGGKFNFTIGEPNSLIKVSDKFYLEDLKNSKISNPDAKCVEISFKTTGDGFSGMLWRENETSTIEEETSYYYVDRDVTISADKTVLTHELDGGTYTETINAFNITLKKGWNALYTKNEITITAANPSHLKWVLSEWEDNWVP